MYKVHETFNARQLSAKGAVIIITYPLWEYGLMFVFFAGTTGDLSWSLEISYILLANKSLVFI